MAGARPACLLTDLEIARANMARILDWPRAQLAVKRVETQRQFSKRRGAPKQLKAAATVEKLKS